VVRAGAGVDKIDIAAAGAQGIYVANCPGRNSHAVAELAIGLLVSMDRRIPEAVAETRAQRWRKAEYSRSRGLAGRTLGVIGIGRIGLAVLRAGAGLGMNLLAWNRHPRPAEQARLVAQAYALGVGVEVTDDITDLARRSDAISVHVASVPATRGLVSRAVFEAMRPGTYFINTARAEVVDHDAMRWALEERSLRVGLDVFVGEPSGGTGTIETDLVRHPSVWATPHIGASTDQAQEAVADEAIRIVLAYRDTGAAPNCLNVSPGSPATHLLLVRHLNRVGVLSHVFATLRDGDINVSESENVVFAGAEACIARIHIDAEPAGVLLSRIREGCTDILALSLVSLGQGGSK
jgi:D-3-phosphoglycerate dehydrogenase